MLQQQQSMPYIEQVRSEEGHYANTIMLLGYGGFFALWASTHARMASLLFAACGLLMGISLLLFIGFELVKTFGIGLAVRKGATVNTDGHRIFSDHEIERMIRARYDAISRCWLWFFVPSAITGLTAGFGLLGFFIWTISKGTI